MISDVLLDAVGDVEEWYPQEAMYRSWQVRLWMWATRRLALWLARP